MIVQWILYSILVSVLVGIAAGLGESALLRHRLPARWVWLAAMAGTVAVPTLALWRTARTTAAASAVGAGDLVTGVAGGIGPGVPAGARPGFWPIDPALLLPFDIPLLLLWAAGSTIVAFVVATSHLTLRRRRRHWRLAQIDGRTVLVSAETGPAVVGFSRGVIVVPEWVVQLPDEQKHLLISHEAEHLRAGDGRLLFAGLAFLVLLPWNPAIWWQFRRLRFAIEIDCDTRVMRRSGNAGAYGTLLLEVGRRTIRPPVAAAAFSKSPSQLERRVRMLIHRQLRGGWAVSALVAGTAMAVFVASCQIESPDQMPRITAADTEEAGDPGGATGVEGGGSDNATPERLVVLPDARGNTAAPAGDDGSRSPEPLPRISTRANGSSTQPVATPAANASGPGQTPQFTPTEVRPQLRNAGAVASEVERQYPLMFKDAGIGGTVILWVYIGDDGKVLEVRVYESSGYSELDAAAVAAMRVAEFSPASDAGRAVPVWIQIPVTFRVE